MANRTCKLSGCDGKVYGHGWCSKHYQRWRKYGDPARERPFAPLGAECRMDGCDDPNRGRGLCDRHYYHLRKYGDPLHADQVQPGHGLRDTPEYTAWAKLRDRCNNPRSDTYSRYGGRGISVCEQWDTGFTAFYNDMGPRPSPDHSIDRINNDGNYEPENCRWATREQQMRNRRVNRVLTFQGRAATLAEWSETTGLSSATIKSRLDQLGWPVDRALGTPLMNQGRKDLTAVCASPSPVT